MTFFGVLSSSSSRLTSNKNGLIAATSAHTLVGSLSNGKNVWPALVSPFANIQFHSTESVDWEAFVWVDSNTEETRVGVNQLVLVPDNRIPEDTGISKICEVSHVFSTIVVARVDLADLILLEDLHLTIDLDSHFCTILGLYKSF